MHKCESRQQNSHPATLGPVSAYTQESKCSKGVLHSAFDVSNFSSLVALFCFFWSRHPRSLVLVAGGRHPVTIMDELYTYMYASCNVRIAVVVGNSGGTNSTHSMFR